jgi:two-component system phosphate regulon response regulator PhoB
VGGANPASKDSGSRGNLLFTLEESQGLGEALKIIAVLAANPALSSILTMVLAGDNRLRVRQFDSLAALATYMSLTPIDIVVCDFDCKAAPAEEVAVTLRGDAGLARRDFQIIALTQAVTPRTRYASVSAGIDEVIVKPMSPKYLHERVVARLRQPVAPSVSVPGYHGPDRRNRVQMPMPERPHQRAGDNVVWLFPR